MSIDINKLKKSDYDALTPEEIEKSLNDMQVRVTKHNGTEPPFRNEFDKHTEEGIYVDLYDGKVLFTSLDKYDSGCGWPAFTKTFDESIVKEINDFSHGMFRTEVRSSGSDSHLGHVFTDGPKDKGGLRYCINSAALRFIPKDKMEELGYGEFLGIFK